MPNPFQEHADNMAAYRAGLDEPVNGAEPGGSVFYKSAQNTSGASYPAVIGTFELQSVLNAGFSPSFVMLAEAIVQKKDLPAGVTFRSGTHLTATQIGGSVYECLVMAAEDVYTEWRLKLQDRNYKA